MQPIKLGLAFVLETIIALPVTAVQQPVWQSPSRQTRVSGLEAICGQVSTINYTTMSYKLPFKGSVRLRQKYCLGENLQFATGTFRDAGGDRLCTGTFRLLALRRQRQISRRLGSNASRQLQLRNCGENSCA